MQERGATQEDVGEAVKTASAALPDQERINRWQLIGGRDLDGDELNVVIAVDGNTVTVVTIMGN